MINGMLSGSAVANVMTVGTSTIPLMKKIGYKSTFAGGWKLPPQQEARLCRR
ncbi:TRAP transporter large permease subunit [Bacillus sp. EB93]|nr:TRAP transporter large permease subunit [Peribacillus frigoritolerans]